MIDIAQLKPSVSKAIKLIARCLIAMLLALIIGTFIIYLVKLQERVESLEKRPVLIQKVYEKVVITPSSKPSVIPTKAVLKRATGSAR